MKFGKYLEARQLELPEYVGHFINYKQLKKLIKQLAAVPQDGPVEKTLQDNKTSFFFRLERELEKVNSFYLEKESDLKIRLDILVKKKQEAISKNRLGSRESIAYINLYDGFKRFARDLDRLEQFIELNQTGFSKVLKKWDKRSKSHTKELYLSKAVSVQPVFNRAEISLLNDLCSSSLVLLNAKVEGEDVGRFENANQSVKEFSNLKLASGTTVNAPADNIPIDDFEIDELYAELLTICDSSNANDLLIKFVSRIKSSINSSLKLSKLFFSSISTNITDELLQKFYNESEDLINLNHSDEISQRNIIHEACSNQKFDRHFILELAVSQNLEIINKKDISGRFPLHYASELGKSEIIKLLATQPETLQYLNVLDYDSMTPLLLAISKQHLDTVKTLLELGADSSPTNTEENPQYLPLNYACTIGNYQIVELLLTYPKVYENYQKDAEGLLPLHVVAKTGQWELVELLVSKNADPNELDGFNKWTPIFYSVSEGHVKTTEKLIENGAKIDIKNDKNYYPIFYAAWEGHVDVLNVLIKNLHEKSSTNKDILTPLEELKNDQILQPPPPPSFSLNPEAINIDTIPDLSLPPPIIPLRRYGHNFLEKKIFVQLQFELGRSSLILNESSTTTSSPGRVVISSKISDVVPRNLILPLTDIDNIIAFQIDSLQDFQIDFEIFPSFGTKLIAKTSALSNVFKSVSNDGLKNFVTLPLFDGRLKTIGELTFQFQIIHPYSGTPLEISKYDTYWKSTSGNNNATVPLQTSVVQNVLSFVTASSLSGDYVKTNVTLLSDGTPIVCPSWDLEILNTSIPISQLSKDQFKSLINYQDSLNSFKLSLAVEEDLVSDPQKFQYLIHLKNQLQSNYILLDDFLAIIPEFVNLNLEVLYPTEAEISQLPITLPESTNVNMFVDSLLTSIFNHVRHSRSLKTENSSKRTRSIVFSSRVQSVCSILNWKQPNYPVFFNISGIFYDHSTETFSTSSANGFSVDIITKEDPTTRSIKEATRFATVNNILGVICPNELLKMIPDLVEVIRSRGLILVASERTTSADTAQKVKGGEIENIEKHKNDVLVDGSAALLNGLNNDINGVRFDNLLSFKGDIDM
jgi:CDK inhibitor PHO81